MVRWLEERFRINQQQKFVASSEKSIEINMHTLISTKLKSRRNYIKEGRRGGAY